MGIYGVSDVVAAHNRSLTESFSSRTKAIAAAYGPAVATAVAIPAGCFAGVVELAGDLSLGGSMATALALFAGLLFGLSLTVLDKAIDMDLGQAIPGEDTTRAALRLQAMAANTLFTSIAAGSGTFVILVGELVPATAEVAQIFAAAITVLVGTNGLIIAQRVLVETNIRTNSARSSGPK